MNSLLKSSSGQALLEYILVFGMMSIIAVGMVRGVSGYFNSSIMSLGYTLTDKLMTGVCPRNCFYGNYGNGK